MMSLMTTEKNLDLSDEELKTTKSEEEKLLQDHFELQISKEAFLALKSKDFIKSAMLSWSYIEEYYLPSTIYSLAKFHKLPLKKSIIEKTNVSILIHYYYFLSHDHTLYLKLEKARKTRNDLVHNLYGSSAIQQIDELARKSAQTNVDLIIDDIWEREEGKVNYPSTMIAINARNDLRREQREIIYGSSS